MKILNDWKDFFSFLKKPNYLAISEGFFPKCLLTLNLFILNVLLVIPFIIAFFIYLLITKGFPKTNIENVIILYHPIILYSMVAVYEEFSFRGFLKNLTHYYFLFQLQELLRLILRK